MPKKGGGKTGGKASSSRDDRKPSSRQLSRDGNRQITTSSSPLAKPAISKEPPLPWTTSEELSRSLSAQWTRIAPQVELLSLCCKPSPGLPPDFAAEFCHPPTLESIYHACNSPAFIGTLSRVLNIPLGTLVIIPPAKANKAVTEKTVHPAAGQFGLFACATIPPRTFLGPYLGVVHTEQESDAGSNYDLRIWAERKRVQAAEDARALAGTASSSQSVADNANDDEETEQIPLGVDATHAGGVLRFVNDYRGILIRPNVFFQDWSAPADPDYQTPDGGESSASITDPDGLGSRASLSPRIVRGIGMFTGARPVEAGTELCVSYGKGFWQARAEEGSSD